MTAEQALAFINSASMNPDEVDSGELAAALQVLAPLAEQDPSGIEAQAFNLGLQLAQQMGLLPPPESPTQAAGGIAPSATGVNPNQAQTPPSSIPAATSTGPPPPAGTGAGAVLTPQAGALPGLPPEDQTDETPKFSNAEKGLSPIGQPPIGVDPGFSLPPPVDPRQSPEGARAAGQMATAVRPRYFQGDELIPSTMDPIEIQRVQRELVRAGLLEKNTFVPGFWDKVSQQAYFDALGYANQAGKPVDMILKQLAAIPRPEEPTEAELRQVRQFVPTDPAALAQRVKSEFRQALGREPTPEEIRALAGSLGGFEQAAFNQETAIMEGQIQAGERDALIQGATGGSQVLPGSPTAGPQVPSGESAGESPFNVLPAAPAAIDPVARFLELFDQKYGPEKARNTAVAGTQQQYNNVMQSITTMQSLFS